MSKVTRSHMETSALVPRSSLHQCQGLKEDVVVMAPWKPTHFWRMRVNASVMRLRASGDCPLASHPGTHPLYSGIHPSHPSGCQCHSLFSNVRLPNVLVCLGCLNKVPEWVASTTEINFLIVLKAGSPRSRCWRFGFS